MLRENRAKDIATVEKIPVVLVEVIYIHFEADIR